MRYFEATSVIRVLASFFFSLNKGLLFVFHCLKYMLINIDHLGHAKASFTVPLTQGMNNISCCFSALDQEADFLSLFHKDLIGGILVNINLYYPEELGLILVSVCVVRSAPVLR